MVSFLTLCLFLTLSYLLPVAQSISTNFNNRVCEHHSKDGEYIIGSIFKIYDNSNTPCDGALRLGRLAFVEAMTFAIDSVNKRHDLLPNINLGYEIRTDCGDEDIALWTTMIMTSSVGTNEYTTLCPDNKRTNNKSVIAVIGTGRSTTSLLAAKVGKVFAVPIVSHFATSDELSDSIRFPFFHRTVPADKFQVKVIIDILLHYNWKYIALFYSLDSYGIHGARQILSLADKAGICIPISMPVSIEASAAEIKEIGDKLIAHDKIYVIVSFAISEPAYNVLVAIKNANIFRKFTFIGSDAWTPHLANFEQYNDLLVGGIFVRFFSESSAEFLEYFNGLPINQDTVSHWYKSKIREIYSRENCTDWSKCPIPQPHWNAQQVINAVNLIAHALNATLQESTSSNASTFPTIDGHVLNSNLLRVSFNSGPNTTIQFDSDGEVPGKYQIQSWQVKEDGYGMVDIGTWDARRKRSNLNIDDTNIQWGVGIHKVPTSLCTEECEPGYILVPLEKKCCWGCQRCNDYAFVENNINGTSCHDCPMTHWPDENFTTCLPITPAFLDYDDITSLLTVVGVGFGLFLILLTAVGLRMYAEEPLMKASSLKLCHINLIGMGYACLTVVLFNLWRPSTTSCAITSASISLSTCITFTPILLKVNRIWRIFSLELGDQLRFASNRSQIIIAATIIIVQVLVSKHVRKNVSF